MLAGTRQTWALKRTNFVVGLVYFDRSFGSRLLQKLFCVRAGARMSEFLATALGLAFALVVCLLAVHAVLSPWVRLRRAPARAIHQQSEKQIPRATQSRDTTPVHTA